MSECECMDTWVCRQEEGVRAPEAIQLRWWDVNSGLLQEQQLLLTTESSLQPAWAVFSPLETPSPAASPPD